MWPDCTKNLTPFKFSLRSELPRFLSAAFENRMIVDEKDMNIPIQIISLLGHCSTDKYIECPNITEARKNLPEEYLARVGHYYWLDFDIFDAERKRMQLRLVFNEGSADCNDGRWGGVWERNTKNLVANISKTGDMQTTIELISEELLFEYKPHDIWLPFTSACSSSEFRGMLCANKLQIEDLVRIAIRWCETYTEQEYSQQYDVSDGNKDIYLLKDLGEMQVKILNNEWDSLLDFYKHRCSEIDPGIIEEIESVDLSHYQDSISSAFSLASSYALENRGKAILLSYELSDWQSDFFVYSNYSDLYETDDEYWAENMDEFFTAGNQPEFGQVLRRKLTNQDYQTNKIHERFGRAETAGTLLYLMSKTASILNTIACDYETSKIRLCLMPNLNAPIHRLRIAA